MSAAVANSVDSRLKPYLTVSGILHVVLLAAMILSAFLKFPGDRWAGTGGGGDNVKVNLVNSAGIPMPKPTNVTESNVVDPTKSLHKEEEKPKPPEPPTKAEKIPQFDKNKPLPPTHKSKVFENKKPEPDNAVPGHGGAPNLATGVGSYAWKFARADDSRARWRGFSDALWLVYRIGETARAAKLAAKHD